MKMLHSRVSIVTIGAAAAFAASSIIASSAAHASVAHTSLGNCHNHMEGFGGPGTHIGGTYCYSGNGHQRAVVKCHPNGPGRPITDYGDWVTAGHWSGVNCGSMWHINNLHDITADFS